MVTWVKDMDSDPCCCRAMAFRGSMGWDITMVQVVTLAAQSRLLHITRVSSVLPLFAVHTSFCFFLFHLHNLLAYCTGVCPPRRRLLGVFCLPEAHGSGWASFKE